MIDDILLENLRKKMNVSFDVLLKNFSGLRTGRASVMILDNIMVEAYGDRVPIQQVGTVNVPEAKLLTVQVWDSSLIKATEAAIRNASLGLNPVIEGQLIRIPIPDLSEERRQEICKLAGKYAEQSKISMRNVRKDGMDKIKKQEKNKEITEDEYKRISDDIQKLTDELIKKIDEAFSVKEKEIMKV
ncbi:MAG: ribosome recycling factor [Holosporaceae bacterium]|jgi:ribosome recycling factor|nr:ribosome recycling factor [Holosporaceae bacterium]